MPLQCSAIGRNAIHVKRQMLKQTKNHADVRTTNRTPTSYLFIIIINLLCLKAAHNMYRQKKQQKLNSKIHQKLETIEQIQSE